MIFKNFNKKQFAFSLAELLLCMMIIGIIVAVTTPVLSKFRPNKYKTMFRKAYEVTDRIVFELINDEELYKSTTGTLGFDNTDYPATLPIGYTVDDEQDETRQGKTKFCTLFRDKIQPSVIHSCDEESAANPYEKPAFATADGIVWTMPITTFSNKNVWNYIYLDVNGTDKPNCACENSSVCDTCKNPDRFRIGVRVDGKIFVPDPVARGYLKDNRIQ